MERTTELHSHLAHRILAHVRAVPLPSGHHLTEQSLQSKFGVSRGPIRAALNFLAEHGVVAREPNRGYFVGSDTSVAKLPETADELLYRTIAEDRISGVLPAVVSETELARRYDIGRHRLARVLDRIAAEGWIEKRRGHGWTFLALINSAEAYRECYDLRVLLEPAALQLPTFRADANLLSELEREQRFVIETGYAVLSHIELFETNSRFHEGLARLSGNRFVHQTIIRQNQLRRLVEYRWTHDPDRLRRVSNEHLGIIHLIKAGDMAKAAEALSAHLTAANKEKTRSEDFVALSEGP